MCDAVVGSWNGALPTHHLISSLREVLGNWDGGILHARWVLSCVSVGQHKQMWGITLFKFISPPDRKSCNTSHPAREHSPARYTCFQGKSPRSDLTLLQGYHVPDIPKTAPGGTSPLSPTTLRGNSLTRSQTCPRGKPRGSGSSCCSSQPVLPPGLAQSRRNPRHCPTCTGSGRTRRPEQRDGTVPASLAPGTPCLARGSFYRHRPGEARAVNCPGPR